MATRISEDTRQRIAAAWPDLLARFAAGELIKDVLKDLGFSRSEVSAYKLATPGAVAEWDEAREASADALFDEALEEGRKDVDKFLAQHVRTRIDALKWAARIRNPRMYGDKAQLDVNVRTVDLTRIIADANARLAASQQGRVIEHDTNNNQEAERALAHALPAIEAHTLKAAGLL